MSTRSCVVAYPHPSIPLASSQRLLVFPSTVGVDAIRGELRAFYPDHAGDLNKAEFWKVSRPLVVQPQIPVLTDNPGYGPPASATFPTIEGNNEQVDQGTREQETTGRGT